LPILSTEHPAYSSLIEDAECSSMQIILHVCVGLKDYFEAHLHVKVRQYRVKIRDFNLVISLLIDFFTAPGYTV